MAIGGFVFLIPVATMCDRTLVPAAHQDISTSFRWSLQHWGHRKTCQGTRQDRDAARRVEASHVFTVNRTNESRFYKAGQATGV